MKTLIVKCLDFNNITVNDINNLRIKLNNRYGVTSRVDVKRGELLLCHFFEAPYQQQWLENFILIELTYINRRKIKPHPNATDSEGKPLNYKPITEN